jgi:tetratricopeptide (TPR) repeat protein
MSHPVLKYGPLVFLTLALLSSLSGLQQVQALPLPSSQQAGSILQSTATPAPKAATIQSLLDKADAYFDATFLISPPGKNALETYQEVLKLDPLNAHAEEKMHEMARICKAWGDGAYIQGFQVEATTFYQRYLRIAQALIGAFNATDVQAGIQEVNTRLAEMGSAPLTPETNIAQTEPTLTAPTPLASPTSSATLSTYLQRFVAGEDVWGDLNQNPLFQPLLGIGGGILLILLAVGIYWIVIRPRMKRRLLNKALKLIDAQDESKFSQADDLLERALTSGMDKRSIEEARFSLAYVKARLKKYPEAWALVQKILSGTEPDQAVAYLAIWLQFQQKQYAEVERFYERYRELLGDFLETKMIAGIAYLNLGQQHWERREVEEAVRCFDVLRAMKILTEYLPKHIDDHQIVLGINSLFDGKVDQARKFFESAIAQASKAGKATFEGELGLLACEWREHDYPNIDDKLGQVIAAMERAPRPFENDDKENGANVLMRHVLLWHVVSLLFTWLQIPEKTGLPEGETAKALQRIEQVKKLDSRNADAALLHGLIVYYFDRQHDEQAVSILKQALDSGVNVPEVINLVNREEKVLEQRRKALDLYLQLAKKYLNDNSIPLELRQELKSHLDKFPRFQKLDKEIQLGSREDDALPSLQDIRTRGELLQKRVGGIVLKRLVNASEDDRDKINGLLTSLTQTTETLGNTQKELERTEQELMLQTGEFLLLEEDKPIEKNLGTPKTVALSPSTVERRPKDGKKRKTRA